MNPPNLAGSYETESTLHKTPGAKGPAWTLKIFLRPKARRPETFGLVIGGSRESLEQLKAWADGMLKKPPRPWPPISAGTSSVRRGRGKTHD